MNLEDPIRHAIADRGLGNALPVEEPSIPPAEVREYLGMSSDEVSFLQLLTLVRRSWTLLAGLALLAGLLVGGYHVFFVPPVYTSTANVLARAQPDGPFGVEIYRSLLQSDRVLEMTSERLRGQGILAAGETLVLGRDVVLERWVENSEPLHLLRLTAYSEEPARTAALANTWARVMIEESRGMLPTPAQDAEAVIGTQLVTSRQSLDDLQLEQKELLDEYIQRENDLASRWDSRINAKQRSIDTAVATYKLDTRLEMEKAVSAFLARVGEVASIAGGAVGADAGLLETRLSDMVSLRAQLAHTPRVLKLEKAASDETVLELLAKGDELGGADSTLVSQELNPLYDELSLRALQLESDLKAVGGGRIGELSQLLTALERIQLERGAGLAAIQDGGQVEVRVLRRRRAHEIDQLGREREGELEEMRRRQQQLEGLDDLLTTRFNTAVVGTGVDELDTLSLAAPAIVPARPESRSIAVRVATAMLVGMVLGLVLALFRSA